MGGQKGGQVAAVQELGTVSGRRRSKRKVSEKSGVRNYQGLKFDRYFTRDLQEGQSVYDTVDWKKTDVLIEKEDEKTGEKSVVFEQRGVEFPEGYSPLAAQVIASKYFYGENGTDEREFSHRQLVGRVSESLGEWGLQQGYFKTPEQAQAFVDENAAIALQQRAAFNSPTWFNTGINRRSSGNKSYIIDKSGKVLRRNSGNNPQTAACFIQSVNDTIESITNLSTKEVLLFKGGSGTGTDFSTLRSSKEKLTGGGVPSGPVSYMSPLDRFAAVIKSGGKTRRAAKLASLKVEHPDIEEFITCKTKERAKMQALIDQGFSYEDAAATVDHQNTNLSVRASDDFMKAVEEDKIWQTIPVNNPELADQMPKPKAKDLLRKIAEGTHICGDPGMQYDTTINDWHTCSETTRINASNPCSEYMFINDSACNLASQNLVNFLGENGRFNVRDFSSSVRTIAIAQDIEIDASSYPTKEIAENAHKYRPLGQGSANLGSLIMRLGCAYDSDEGRAIAATVQALQTGKVYESSNEMARNIGTFEEYESNKKSFLRVLEKHRSALKNVDREKLPEDSGLKEAYDEAVKTWNRLIPNVKKTGLRNAQATVFAPTGTIGFMMDCDTTGIEPDLALRKTKKLAGGGIMKIANQSVDPALRKLGYEERQRKSILNHIEEKGTIEGSELEDRHLAIFDCANPAPNGKRFIHYRGHLKMMATVQPFLSGAISKTVNIPKETTVDEIMDIYMEAWKMGIKSVAIYRDGSHPRQPLSASGEKNLEGKVGERELKWGERRKLPPVHHSLSVKFEIADHKGYYHVGLREDGSPGDLFVDMSKEGSIVGGFARAWAKAFSYNLQLGMPPEEAIEKFTGDSFEPSGFVKANSRVHLAKSIIDFMMRDMSYRFFGKDDSLKEQDPNLEIEDISGTPEAEESLKNLEKQNGIDEAYQKFIKDQELGDSCGVCSRRMIKKGHCVEICFCGSKKENGCTD